MTYYWFFFFFQAEDGIRDIGVTGVQTCALPISRDIQRVTRRRIEGRMPGRRQMLDALDVFRPVDRFRILGTGDRELQMRQRSEERRVGKECRSRWPRYH